MPELEEFFFPLAKDEITGFQPGTFPAGGRGGLAFRSGPESLFPIGQFALDLFITFYTSLFKVLHSFLADFDPKYFFRSFFFLFSLKKFIYFYSLGYFFSFFLLFFINSSDFYNLPFLSSHSSICRQFLNFKLESTST